MSKGDVVSPRVHKFLMGPISFWIVLVATSFHLKNEPKIKSVASYRVELGNERTEFSECHKRSPEVSRMPIKMALIVVSLNDTIRTASLDGT